MGTVIVTDSGSDFSRAEAERLGIEIVPVWIVFGEKRYKDGVDIDRDTFFKKMKAGEIPKTEPAAVEQYREVFARAVEAGNEVVMISLSSAISESLARASEAAKEFGGKVSLVDSRTASGLETQLTLYALEFAKSGAGAAEIAKRVDPRGLKYAVLFAVPDLTQLGRSGRLPKAVVALGSMLNVSLVLKMNEAGAVAPAGQSFSFDKTCDLMVESLVRAIDHAPNARVAFDHVQAEKTVETMRASLEKKLGHPPAQELIYETSLTLAAHLGIGAVGVSAFVPN
ncbi:MAG TPA: DegV family protein [Candidatus Acidoferrales bacterium]|nr:DegV family protein [Candidatus Acidoferrales bacterium]